MRGALTLVSLAALAAVSYAPLTVREEVDVDSVTTLVAAAAAEDAAGEADTAEPADAAEELDDLADSGAAPDDARGAPVDPAPVAPYRWGPADVLAARSTASPRARCVIDSEVGGVGYSPWAVGRAGERGPVQLHPRGLLPDYLVWSGGAAPENPAISIAYLDHMLAIGQGRHWTAVRLGRC